jgi:4-hydroxy-tetrahydrodipicolinate reductase
VTRLVVAGAAGRMGRMIVAAAAGTEGCVVAGAFDRPGNPSVGQDAGLLAGVRRLDVPVADGPVGLIEKADVLVDFTAPAVAGVAVVIGTTGLSDEQKGNVGEASGRVPIVFSPNMSVGVNLTFKIIEEVARVLGASYDIEIVEAHHRLKKDSPSGTAARMLEVLAGARGLDPATAAVHGREGMVGERPLGQIGVHAVRGGDIVGDHTVLFAGPGERIEITHRAHSRETFARGAVRAALWLKGRAPGLYDMGDVLGLR